MSTHGYLACDDCEEVAFLGSCLRDEKNKGVGFWHDDLCKDGEANGWRLGRMSLHFLARHLGHRIRTFRDDGKKTDQTHHSHRDVQGKYGYPDARPGFIQCPTCKKQFLE